ncbi:hypothetical protein B0H10DRAFT_2187411 [Mycena sp. CBHHK59/15]|nr:hypothetical protein B0H10DRAFT_2187411 [Mycena sp. CBHHK59/15]
MKNNLLRTTLSQFNTAMTLFRKQGKKAAAPRRQRVILAVYDVRSKKNGFWRLVPVRTKFGPSGQNLFGQKWADRVWSGSSLQRDYQGSWWGLDHRRSRPDQPGSWEMLPNFVVMPLMIRSPLESEIRNIPEKNRCPEGPHDKENPSLGPIFVAKSGVQTSEEREKDEEEQEGMALSTYSPGLYDQRSSVISRLLRSAKVFISSNRRKTTGSKECKKVMVTTKISLQARNSENGGLARAGDAEKSDAEGEAPPSAPLGRGQRKKIGTSRYQWPLWEAH